MWSSMRFIACRWGDLGLQSLLILPPVLHWADQWPWIAEIWPKNTEIDKCRLYQTRKIVSCVAPGRTKALPAVPG
jgi:hypothetical protein